jgi:beta-lactamase regulating signal transducer with metallopeptidase domain
MNLTDFSIWLNSLTEWLFFASLKSLPLLGLILLLQAVLRKHISAASRHSLWLILVVSLGMPFGWQIEWPGADNLFPKIDTNQVLENEKIYTAAPDSYGVNKINPGKTIENKISNSPTIESIPLGQVFSYLWLCGLLVVGILSLQQFRHLNRIRKTAVAVDNKLAGILEICKSKLTVNRKIIFLFSDKIHSPLTMGLFTPVIILPKNNSMSETMLQHVLLHELSHIKRLDIFWNWLVYWIAVLHWFNPLIWWASKRIRADMEIACDASVLENLKMEERTDYGRTLIEISQLISKPQVFNSSLGILENHSELKYRLIMIKNYTTMNLKTSLLFATLLSLLTFTALAQPGSPSSSTKNTKTTMTLQQFSQHVQTVLKAPVLVGHKYANFTIPVNLGDVDISYGQFLSQLKINGFTAYRSKDYIQIIPVEDAMAYAIPTAEKGKTYFEDEFVTDYLKLEKACADKVLFVIRPMVPQYAYLNTLEGANTLIISDFYQNIVRVKATIKALEDNIKAPVNCNNTQLTNAK